MKPLRFDAANLDHQQEAAARLNAGELVALPTETVYGLAARSDIQDAVVRVYDAKQRPRNKALPVLVADIQQAKRLWSESANWRLISSLTNAFWPGPLTVVAEARADLPGWLTGDDGTLALRCPNQPQTLAILSMLAAPVVCPSANHSDDPSPTSADAVEASLADRVDAIVESRLPIGGMESTIVKVNADNVEILRAGALSRFDIQRAVPGSDVKPPELLLHSSATKEHSRVLYVGPRVTAPIADAHLAVDTLDEAFSKIHAFLAAIPREERVVMGYAIEPSFESDARVDGLRRVLERYLGR